jgi:recombination protein RecA
MTEMTHHPDQIKALEAAMAHIQKTYGAGAIMRLDGSSVGGCHPVIPTGSLGLDIALGIGGLPRGRMVEIYGPEASGKTTVALHVIASCQAMGGTAAFIDAEHALDAAYAGRVGIQLEKLLLSQPDSGEQALEICELLVRSGAVDLVVIDSVAALVPEAEINGQMADLQVGLQARLLSKAMRKLTGCISKSQCTVLFVNQLRAKIGVVFGPKEVTTGGNALKYYTSVRLDIRRIGALKDGDEHVGNRTRVKVVKNKLAAPFRTVEFDLRFGEGISRESELLDLAEDKGLLTKRGNWYHLDDLNLGNGREAARARLVKEPELRTRLEQLVLSAHGLVSQDQVPES